MTTGQPIKYPSDRNKYNNEFNESLQLQIDLNQRNLEANRLYKETGQLPASTQMQDTRSNEEKLADIEGLKRSIVSDLAPVAEPAFANAVIQGVLTSPLNVDNSLFRYLAQNASSFAQSLGRKYKFGIAGDANDVEVMVQFLEDAYNKTKNSFQSIKGYIDSNTNQGIRSKSNTLSANDTDNVIVELKDAIKRFEFLRKELEEKAHLAGIAPDPGFVAEIVRIVRFISEVVGFLPTTQQMNIIVNELQSNVYNNLGPIPDEDLLHSVMKILQKLPRLPTLATLFDNAEKAIRKMDFRKFGQCGRGIINLFADFMNPGNTHTLVIFRDEFINRARVENDRETLLNRVHTINDIRLQNQHNIDMAKAQRVYVINPADDPAKVLLPNNQQGPGGPPPPLGPPPPGPVDFIPPLQPGLPAPVGNPQVLYRNYIANEIQGLSDQEIDQVIQALLARPVLLNTPGIYQNGVALLQNPAAGPHAKRAALLMVLQSLEGTHAYDPQNGVRPFGVRGLGLLKTKKGRGISTKYKPFGEHEINHKNLEKGIFTMRRKTKSNIMGLPSKHVSKHFQNIIHNIMGGKIADFTDIHNLSDDEKNYLHKIISKSNLQDRLSVPAPSKDQQEKDFHNFEVMKGEILAGNDSKELIKNFKVLVMKLTRQNLLPKNEVMDLFQDLLSLGY